MAECLAWETGSRRPRWNLHQRVQSRSHRKTTLLPKERKAQVRVSLSKQPTLPPGMVLSLALGAVPRFSSRIIAVLLTAALLLGWAVSLCVLNLAYQKTREGRRRGPKVAEPLRLFFSSESLGENKQPCKIPISKHT